MSIDVEGTLVGDAESRDTVARFAADLRQLRLEADSPTLTKLQNQTSISKSVLSDAFAGRQLPSARTVDRVVRACGAEPRSWLERRDALAGVGGPSATTEGAGAESVTVDIASAASAKHPVTRGVLAWVASAAFVAGVVGSALVTAFVVPLFAPAAAEAGPQIVVQNGTDPAATECVDDARVATGDTRADNSLLEIVWSDACQAGWGRITRYDGLGSGNTVTIAIYPQTAPDGAARQEATEHDVQGAYTTLVVRPSPDTLLCAEGSFTVDGTRIDLGDPLCI